MFRIALLSFALAGTAACATSTPYKEAISEYGYSSIQLDNGTYHVSFRGNRHTPRETVDQHLMRRMADLTLSQGGDYFRVLEHDTKCHTSFRFVDTDPGAGGMFSGYSYACKPYSAVAPAERHEYEAYADMTIHTGPVPEDDDRAHDARDVLERLQHR